MSHPNPTPIRIGMAGTLAGRRFRVAGRMVMAMDDAGATWRWTEFHLVSDSGESATLVYEDVEGAVQWRLFTLFEPATPLTAAEAARRKVGDVVDIDGTRARVTLVDESRVEWIEGEAPEGVETGDVARYFNADAGNQMIVVSWTGEEVEYYRGMDLPARAVYTAFGVDHLPPPPAEDPFAKVSSGPGTWIPKLVLAVGAAIIALVAFKACRGGSSDRSSELGAITKPVAAVPASRFEVGSSVTLGGQAWRVEARRRVEVRRHRQAWERHEYWVVGPAGERRWLVGGLDAGRGGTWVLGETLTGLQRPGLDAFRAAALRVGETIPGGSFLARVTDLFQITVREVEPGGAWPLEPIGARRFGLVGTTPSGILVATWDEQGIAYAHGERVSPP